MPVSQVSGGTKDGGQGNPMTGTETPVSQASGGTKNAAQGSHRLTDAIRCAGIGVCRPLLQTVWRRGAHAAVEAECLAA